MVIISGASASTSVQETVSEGSQVITPSEHSVQSTERPQFQENYASAASACSTVMTLLEDLPQCDTAPQIEPQVSPAQEPLQDTQNELQRVQASPEAFTEWEREELLDRAEQYGRDRAKLEMELRAYEKNPPTSECGRERVAELTKGIQELDESAAENMQSIEDRLGSDPDLSVRLRLEFTPH